MNPATPTIHISGQLLGAPNGPEDVSLTVSNGRLRLGGTEGTPLHDGPVWILPGLVDAHTHVDYPQELVEPGQRAAFVRRNLMQMTEAGTLLLRDLGASSRTLAGLQRMPGQAIHIPSGRALIGCRNACFQAISSEAAVASAVAEVSEGVTWVKIFVDWPQPAIQDDAKATYFRPDNPLTYPPEVLEAAVRAVQERGGRVAAHAFTEHGARACIDAGVNSIEHGWGITEAMIPELVEKGIAWIPLLSLREGMQAMAGRDGRPDQVDWVEDRWAHLARVLPLADAAGVDILAGTDWFPAVTLSDEARHMTALGMSAESAIAAASTRARRFFGFPGVEDGAPADLCVYRSDPRRTPERLAEPDWIIAGGLPVIPRRPQAPQPASSPHAHSG